MIPNMSCGLESNQDFKNLPILSFLKNQQKKSIQYIKFRIQTVIIHKSFAEYQIKVNEYGKIWIMETRYTTLQQLYQKLKKNFGIKLTFPSKLLFGNLCPKILKKRAIKIQQFLKELGSNYQLINSYEFTQFLTNKICSGTQIIDFTQLEEFQLDA
ncbi:unnamed protein product [Paramecium sonneborni]|uniref:PX domain-containing protein n=1 Tax=Paramecium sonneborni TaxID=65129 RepID=A0A8S1NR54_9CILI|nr:unnamed protein product [Paramecium sonneborni]